MSLVLERFNAFNMRYVFFSALDLNIVGYFYLCFLAVFIHHCRESLFSMELLCTVKSEIVKSSKRICICNLDTIGLFK